MISSYTTVTTIVRTKMVMMVATYPTYPLYRIKYPLKPYPIINLNLIRPLLQKKLIVPLCRSDDFVDNAAGSDILTAMESVSKQIRNRLSKKIVELEQVTGTVPVIGIVCVENHRSKSFVKKILEASKEIGMGCVISELRVTYTKQELIDALKNFNKNASIHGIHVQGITDREILHKVKLQKDIDGLQLQNALDLFHGNEPDFFPPSVKGIMEFFLGSKIVLDEKVVVIVGSTICTIHMVHSLKMKKLAYKKIKLKFSAKKGTKQKFSAKKIRMIKKADVVIYDCGDVSLPQEWLKTGVVVFDVGRCPIEDGVSNDMTINMIMLNTLDAAAKQIFA